MSRKDEIIATRKQLIGNSEKVTYIKKDNRQVNTPRICAVCGRQLSVYDPFLSRYVVTYPHKHLVAGGFLKLDICPKSDNCVAHIKK